MPLGDSLPFGAVVSYTDGRVLPARPGLVFGVQGSTMTPSRPRAAPPAPGKSSPNLLVAIRNMTGAELDELVGRFVLHTEPERARGACTTWEGARRLVEALTALGCEVVTRLGATRCLCRVSRTEGPSGAVRELATAEGATLPESLARAALLACLEMPSA